MKKDKEKSDKKEKPLKISAGFNDVLKVAVKDNPKPTTKKK